MGLKSAHPFPESSEYQSLEAMVSSRGPAVVAKPGACTDCHVRSRDVIRALGCSWSHAAPRVDLTRVSSIQQQHGTHGSFLV